MSQEALKELIGRALIDKDFRDELYADRPKAIQGYDLSAEDLAELDKVSHQELEGLARSGSTAVFICLVSPPPPPPPDPKPGT